MPLGLHFNTNVKLLKEIHSIFVTSFVLNRVISHNKLQHTAIGIFPKKITDHLWKCQREGFFSYTFTRNKRNATAAST